MAKFQPGKSGNPGGRPTNAVRTAEIRAALLGHAPKILQNLIALALAGDVQASKAILDRVVGPLKAIEPPIKLDIKKTWSAKKQAEAIQHAVYAGEISVTQGQALMANILAQVKIVEASELELRLAALEKTMEKNELTL